jgi:hypothetical protein
MKTATSEQQQKRDGSFASSSSHYRRTDGTVVALPNALLVNKKVSRASPFYDDNNAALLLAQRGGKEARWGWQFFLRKDRTRTKLAKLALLLVALFIVSSSSSSSSSSWNPNSNPKRHSKSFNNRNEEASSNGVKISGPKTALSSMFSLTKNNFPSKNSINRKEQERFAREERANERERLDLARYGPTNEALRGSRESEETRNFGNGMVNRIDWKAKTNQLGREYKEYRRMVDRENRWDGRSQRYGILSRGINDDGGQ